MLRRILSASISVGLVMFAQEGNAATAAPPSHWFISSQIPQGSRSYIGSVDHTTVYSGNASGVLESVRSDPTLSGTLMQRARASAYAGKTVEFSAYLKCKDVARGAGLWLRADAPDGLVVAFKNAWSPSQRDQLLRGSTEWRKVTLVINVPASAVALAYGVQMRGVGTVWIDHVRIETRTTGEKGAEAAPVAVTYKPPPRLDRLGEPANLDFED